VWKLCHPNLPCDPGVIKWVPATPAVYFNHPTYTFLFISSHYLLFFKFLFSDICAKFFNVTTIYVIYFVYHFKRLLRRVLIKLKFHGIDLNLSLANKSFRMVKAISGPELTQGSQRGLMFLWYTKHTIYKTNCLFLPIIYNSTTYNKNSIYLIQNFSLKVQYTYSI